MQGRGSGAETPGPPVWKGTETRPGVFLSFCVLANRFHQQPWPSSGPAKIHMRLQDKHGRFITDLRVSITDCCTYKCVCCRTRHEGAQYQELPFADYRLRVRLFVGSGIEKEGRSGGEPLL